MDDEKIRSSLGEAERKRLATSFMDLILIKKYQPSTIHQLTYISD